MADIQRKSLFTKLNELCYKGIEGATVHCRLAGNPYVELTHWIHQLVQLQDSDFHRILRHFEVDLARVSADITAALGRLPRGATAIADFSPHVLETVEQSWLYTSLLFNDTRVRSGFLVFTLLKTPALKNILGGISPQFARISAERLAEDFANIVHGSPEDGMAAPTNNVTATSGGEAAPGVMGKQEALTQFSVDLTEKARKGEMDPILGRDDEIRQIVDILLRRRQNNPILTGEAGVGKTAVVEGFAQKIVSGDVPPALKDVTLRSLDLGLLQAGASMKGEFEKRLRQVIDEVEASPKPIILFIDEAHTLIGAGGAAGQGDAANLLKPALARGRLRTIAATTWAEYKKYFEKDPALTRRFQVVKVEEPEEDKAVIMIRGLLPVLEKHHNVHVLDEALQAAVRLSHRYIPARQLPDKAVSLIDTACARVAISHHGVPPSLEDARRRIEHLNTELSVLEREMALGVDHTARQEEVLAGRALEQERLEELEARWKQEKELVKEIVAIRDSLRLSLSRGDEEAPSETVGDEDPETHRKRLRELEEQLVEVQGDDPLVLPSVREQAVAAVVADWTGIPVGKMVKDEIQSILNLTATLEKRIIGQSHALETIGKRIRTSRAGLDNPSKPIGVFLLAGTSGVGKTETALALAEALYGGEDNVITINMSEFQEAHTVSTLKGAPPGYVGYGEGGVLTEAVRRRPYSIVLLDEVEKAHPDVHEMFFQVFDKGSMEDGEGRRIDFKNTIILLTTNAGSDLLTSLCRDPEMIPDPDAIAKALRDPLLKVFPAALLGRMLTVPYYPLSEEVLKQIVILQLNRIRSRVEQNHRIPFSYSDAVVDLVFSRCTENESGGRMVDAILTNTLLPAVSQEFLARMLDGNPPAAVHVDARDGEFVYRFDREISEEESVEAVLTAVAQPDETN